MSKSNRDQRLVNEIVDELKKGGPLKNPFKRAYSAMEPPDYVTTEVQRSLGRVRLRDKPPFFVPKIAASAADYRKLGRLLRKMGLTTWAEQLGASDHVVQEPPPRANALKHYCADEAFFLMEMFSASAPTFSTGGPFQIIAQKLYEAVTGRANVDLERACDWVLRERRKYRQHGTTADA